MRLRRKGAEGGGEAKPEQEGAQEQEDVDSYSIWTCSNNAGHVRGPCCEIIVVIDAVLHCSIITQHSSAIWKQLLIKEDVEMVFE